MSLNAQAEKVKAASAGSSTGKVFGRKAVKLSGSQKHLLETFAHEVSIPLTDKVTDPSAYFSVDGPVHLEIGFGNGEYTAELAKTFPRHCIIACEIFLNGIASLLKRIKDADIDNIRIIQGNAVSALRDMFSDGTLDYIHINYPDPWPKKRHHKRRIIQPGTADLFTKVLKEGGELWLSTDIPEYYDWMIECLDASDGLHRLDASGRFLDLSGNTGVVTSFENKGMNKGRRAHHLRYRKQARYEYPEPRHPQPVYPPEGG